jgi:hypothetical protein
MWMKAHWGGTLGKIKIKIFFFGIFGYIWDNFSLISSSVLINI